MDNKCMILTSLGMDPDLVGRLRPGTNNLAGQLDRLHG